MLVVTRSLKTIHVLGHCAMGAELHLINHTLEVFLVLDNSLETFPAIELKEIIISGVNGTSDGVVCSNDGERLGGDLPILPFDHNIPL